MVDLPTHRTGLDIVVSIAFQGSREFGRPF
jgi:hypothetical protein